MGAMESGSGLAEALPWRRRYSWRSQLLISVIIVALIAVAALILWVSYYATESNTFPRELVLLGLTLALSGLGVALTITVSALGLWLLQRREALLSSRLETVRSELTIGRLTIPDITVISAPSFHRSCQEQTHFRFVPGQGAPRSAPPAWAELERTVLPQLQSRAKAAGQVFDNGEIVDLVSAELARGGPGEKNTFHLIVAPSDYFTWACTSARMDEGNPSLRDTWHEKEQDILRLEDCSRALSPCFVGVVALVLTRERDGSRRLILHQRGNVWVAGTQEEDRRQRRRRIHFVGEGVLPTDLEGTSISVYQAALRGIQEELGLERGDLTSLTMTGVAFDTYRRQPVFCFLAETHLPFGRVSLQARSAPGFFESNDFIPVVWSPASESLKRLMLDRGSRFLLASNHAEIALLFALIYDFGMAETERALS